MVYEVKNSNFFVSIKEVKFHSEPSGMYFPGDDMAFEAQAYQYIKHRLIFLI